MIAFITGLMVGIVGASIFWLLVSLALGRKTRKG